MPTHEAILDALRAIIDPDFQQDIVSLGFVQDLAIRDGEVSFKLELTSPGCALKNWFKTQATQRTRRVPGVTAVRVAMAARQPADADGESTCAHSMGEPRIPAVTITERALAALRQRDWAEGDFMRIGVAAGGCSGHTYTAAVDDELFITDWVVYEADGLRIVTDPESAEYLDGLEIDYSDDLIRSGFRFSNPNASGSCGCGSSFKA